MATSSSKAAGTVTCAIGEVKATAVDGTTRILLVGDRVFAKEVIETSANAVVQLHFENGSLFDLVRDATITLDDGILVGRSSAASAANARHDVDGLQAATAAGDPTRVAEAAAAGPAAPGAGGQETSSGDRALVLVEQANTTGEVTSGFATQSASIGFSTLAPGISPAQQEPAFLVQGGLPLPARHESPGASASAQMQAEADTSHDSGGVVTSPESRILPFDPPLRGTSPEFMANSDKLALNDVLQGHESASDLTARLSFTYDADTNTTTVNVKASSPAAADEKIVLTGVDLTAGGALTTDTIIQNLLTHGKLHTDA